MRPWISVATIVSLVLLPSTSAWSEPSLALRGEGYIGYGHIELGSFDEDAFEGGGAASASLVNGTFYLQADLLGERSAYDDIGPFSRDLDADDVATALHLGWRDPERGSLGVLASYDHTEYDPGDSSETARGGVEGELFVGPVTLAANAGYLQLFDDDSTGYVDFGASFYPTERARIHLSGGVSDIEESDPYGLIGAGGEILLIDVLAAFARWDATLADAGSQDYERHSVVAGIRLYWGAETPSLIEYDRAHFKRTCTGPILLFGRTC